MKTIYTAIVVLSSLSLLLVLLARYFDKHLYVPFLQKMKIEPVNLPEFNPHLFRLGIYVVGCSILFYAMIGLGMVINGVNTIALMMIYDGIHIATLIGFLMLVRFLIYVIIAIWKDTQREKRFWEKRKNNNN